MATMVPMDRSIPWTLGRQTGVKAGAVAGAGVEVRAEVEAAAAAMAGTEECNWSRTNAR